MIKLLGLSYLLAACFVCVSDGLAQQPAVASIRQATVTIEVRLPDGRSGSGSGFLIGSDGIVATAAHVLGGATSGKVRMIRGDEYAIEGVLAIDSEKDLAIIRIAGYALPTVTLGNSDSVEVGERIIVVGAPLGLEATVSDGLISAVRVVDGIRLIQLSAPASPGSSGGPVLNQAGRVVGMIVRGVRGENLNFALPINYLRGHVGLLSARTPSPLAQTATRSTPPVFVPQADIDTSLVNSGHSLNWRGLAGAQVAVTEEVALPTYGNVMSTSVTRYVQTFMSPTRPALERISESRYVAERVFSRELLVHERMRYQVESDSIATYRLVPERLHPPSQRVTRSLTLRNGELTDIVSSENAVVSRVQRGVIFSEMIGGYIAAMPDSLPASFTIWTLDVTSNVPQLRPVQVDVGAASSARVPVAELEGDCGSERVRTTRTALRVQNISITRDGETKRTTLLARHPHLVASEGVTCLSLPPAVLQRHVAPR